MKIGAIEELGLIPCRECGERHAKIFLGKHKAPTWMMNGHNYNEIEPREYIQQQRDQINRLLKIIRRLKSGKPGKPVKPFSFNLKVGK